MTGFVKTEHRQSHNLALPLSTLSRYLCNSPHSSFPLRKSISHSRHSKVHYSLLPAAFSVCYLFHSHYLCLFLQPSSLSSLYWLKSDLMSFLHRFFFGSSFPSLFICLTACVSLLSLIVHSLLLPTYFWPFANTKIFCILHYFKLTLLFPSASYNASPPLSSTPPPLSPFLLPGAACTLSLLAAREFKKEVKAPFFLDAEGEDSVHAFIALGNSSTTHPSPLPMCIQACTRCACRHMHMM